MIAILSDIHSNIQALDAVLADMPKQVTEIIVLGDTIGGLSSPCEVLDRLMNLSKPLTAILGNWEENFFLARKGQYPEWWEGTQFANLAWTYDALQPHHWDYLDGLSSTLAFDRIAGGAFLFHAKPDDSMNGIHTEELAAKAVIGRTEKWLLCGHTHQARLYRLGEQNVVTVGSVGHSMDSIGGAACYVLIDEDRVVFRHVSYDVEATLNDLKNSSLSKCSPGFSKANALSVTTGRNYVHALLHFAQDYDGTWEEGEQVWLESLK